MPSVPTAPPAPIHTPLRPRTLRLEVVSESAGRARRFAREVVAGHPVDVEAVELVVSELVTNAIRAAEGLASGGDHAVHAGVCPTGRWTLLSVRDPGPSGPVRRVARDTDEGGRGLMIVETLARVAWTSYHPHFKVVHALLSAPGVLLGEGEGEGEGEVVAVRAAAERLVLT